MTSTAEVPFLSTLLTGPLLSSGFRMPFKVFLLQPPSTLLIVSMVLPGISTVAGVAEARRHTVGTHVGKGLFESTLASGTLLVITPALSLARDIKAFEVVQIVSGTWRARENDLRVVGRLLK